MGHSTREPARCDLLDELEAAVTLRCNVRVFLRDESHRTGLPTDLVTHDGEDFLHLANHRPIPISMILRVERQ
jgi:ABC-type uncharacterized transport system YnjBCD ATPase subunit